MTDDQKYSPSNMAALAVEVGHLRAELQDRYGAQLAAIRHMDIDARADKHRVLNDIELLLAFAHEYELLLKRSAK